MFLDAYFSADGPGAVLAVAQRGVRVAVECLGFADVENRVPLDTRTAFDLASVTKVFTGAAVMRLAEQGRLALDDPIGRYLGGFAPAAGARAITVRDLLWHNSGLPDYLAGPAELDLAALTPSDVLDRAREWAAEARPGLRHEYGNTNYSLLSHVIEAASGCSYAMFLRHELIEPAGMTDTYVLGAKPRQTRRARGYENVGAGSPRYVGAEFDLSILGDGGVFASADDLLRWQDAYSGGRVLSAATLAEAIAPGRLDDGTPVEYGCGLMVESPASGGTWCGHTGGWIGSSTYLGRFVEREVSVVVLSNDQHAPTVRIAQCFTARHAGGLGHRVAGSGPE